MEDKNLVTLEEMEELFAKEASSPELDILVQGQKGRKLVLKTFMIGSTLSRHLYAERLLQKGYQEVDWSNECPFPVLISTFAETWMRPLVWQDASKYKNMVIDGRIAEEEYDDDRYMEIREVVDYIYEQDILAYADEPIEYDEDLMEIRIPKGIHEWSPLTYDAKSDLDKILGGRFKNESKTDEKMYDCACFRYNLNIIAMHRGGERAVQLLKMLQEEWPKIKLWKIGLEMMDEKDIADFEEQLFHGFNDFLEQWNSDTPQKETSEFIQQRGPKVQYLFADINRNEDSDRTRQEAERLMRYIADHHMGNLHLDSTNSNQLNLLVACFYYEWRKRGWVNPLPQGAAIHRFLTERCNLLCDVMPKAYARAIADLIKGNHKDYNIVEGLRSYFS